MSHALRAVASGLLTVLAAPLLVAGVLVATLAVAIPFGVVLGSRLQAALAQQQPVSAGAPDIDPEWWMEYREHTRGLEATFTPTILGFAAPLDNLSALLDASPRPWALAGPVALSGLAWAFLWGGTLHRFTRASRTSVREFMANGFAHWPRLAVISGAAAVFYVLLYATVHALLFGPVYGRLAAYASSERDAFLFRVVLYLIFGALLLAAALVVDYARIAVVSSRSSSAWVAIRTSARFVREHTVAAAGVYFCYGALFAALLIVYGASEIYGGTRLGGWRAVAIGQAYIVVRLVLRLALAASEVKLVGLLDRPSHLRADR
ncbi:MAG: hypothetical protein ACRD2N_20565 [Vicinamibacterales bacterium]